MVYMRIKERRPDQAGLSPVSQHALESFRRAAPPSDAAVLEEESTSMDARREQGGLCT